MVYFLAHVLQLALTDSIPSDVLFIMLAKINRRLLKLSDTVQSFPGLDSVCILPSQRCSTEYETILEKAYANNLLR
jgi:hypothetical protein